MRMLQTVRSLFRNPRFTTLAVVTFAISIGANLAVFGALNQTFFRPLPVDHPERLVRIEDYTLAADGRRLTTAVLDTHVVELLARARGFASLVAESDQSMTLVADGSRAARLLVLRATAGSWSTLGIRPFLGRFFSADEERTGADAGVLVLSYAVWRERFGGRPDAIGAVVRLDDRAFRVIGVAPAGFRFPWNADAWIPEHPVPGGRRDYAVIGRLAAGMSESDAAADLRRVAREIRAAHPETLPNYGLAVQSLRGSLLEGRQQVAMAVAAVVGLFLAIACANVTNLQLARVVARRSELAVRSALGATGAALFRLVLGESLVLTVAGAVAGALAALWLAPVFSVLIPPALSGEMGFVNDVPDWRLMGFFVALCITSAVVAGTIPACIAYRVDARAVKTSARGVAGAGRRWLGVFVVMQLAIASMLLGATATVTRDFAELLSTPLGVDAEHVVAAGIALPSARYAGPEARAIVARRLLERLARVPGVDGVALTTNNPFAGGRWRARIDVEGRPTPVDAAYPMVNHRLVSPGLFKTLGIPIVAGRSFEDRDNEAGEPVAIVSARLAEHLWPHANPLNQRLRHMVPGGAWRRVVGVAGDVADAGDMNETWYVPYPQEMGAAFVDAMYIMVHAQSHIDDVRNAMESAVQSVDAELSVYDVALLIDQFHQGVLPNKLGLLVIAVLTAVGLLLALIGTYSVTSYIAAASRPEIALRIALGASIGDIVSLELGRTAWLAGLGVALGAGGSLASAAAVRGMLFVRGEADPLLMAQTAIGLFLTALVAGMFPVWRGARRTGGRILMDGPVNPS